MVVSHGSVEFVQILRPDEFDHGKQGRQSPQLASLPETRIKRRNLGIAGEDFVGHRLKEVDVGQVHFRVSGRENLVYTALGQGVVDGQENAWANVYSKKFHEVQDYISVTNHGYLGYLVVVSTEFWNGMPADLRKQVAAILREATEVNRKAAAEADTEERNKVAAAGYAKIVDLTPAEIAKWRAITASVEDKFRDEIGADLLKEIHALLGN